MATLWPLVNKIPSSLTMLYSPGQSLSSDWLVWERYKGPDPPFISGTFQRSSFLLQISLYTDQAQPRIYYGQISLCSSWALCLSSWFWLKISYWLNLQTPEPRPCGPVLYSRRNCPLLYFQAGSGPSQWPGDNGPQGPGGKESKAVRLEHMVRAGHRSLSDQPALYVAVSELRSGKRGLRWWERKIEPGRNQETTAKVRKGSMYWEIVLFLIFKNE